MYYYLFDQVLSHPKYTTLTNRIESRIIELGINGRIDRLSVLKSMRELLESAIKRGAETIVMVGDDAAMVKAISIVAPYNVTFGMIPVGDEVGIGSLLGIPQGEAACDVLSKRMVKTLDLGKVNDQYFLFSVAIPPQKLSVECDGRFRISLLGLPRPFSICNLHPKLAQGGTCSPEDGRLEAVIDEPRAWNLFRKTSGVTTVLPLKRAKINSVEDAVPLTLDGQTIVKTPATVEIAPRKLRVIVGKERRF